MQLTLSSGSVRYGWLAWAKGHFLQLTSSSSSVRYGWLAWAKGICMQKAPCMGLVRYGWPACARCHFLFLLKIFSNVFWLPTSTALFQAIFLQFHISPDRNFIPTSTFGAPTGLGHPRGWLKREVTCRFEILSLASPGQSSPFEVRVKQLLSVKIMLQFYSIQIS